MIRFISEILRRKALLSHNMIIVMITPDTLTRLFYHHILCADTITTLQYGLESYDMSQCDFLENLHHVVDNMTL